MEVRIGLELGQARAIVTSNTRETSKQLVKHRRLREFMWLDSDATNRSPTSCVISSFSRPSQVLSSGYERVRIGVLIAGM